MLKDKAIHPPPENVSIMKPRFGLHSAMNISSRFFPPNICLMPTFTSHSSVPLVRFSISSKGTALPLYLLMTLA